MKARTKAELQRGFGIFVGSAVLFSVGYSTISGDRVAVQAVHLLGFLCLGSYLCLVGVGERKFAGWSLCLVALYLFVIDVILEPFSFTIFCLADKLAGSVRCFFEVFVLAQGYFGLCALDDIKDQEADVGEKAARLRVTCPKCGRSLRGATQEMIGETGVCPKCKAEFVIAHDDEEDD